MKLEELAELRRLIDATAPKKMCMPVERGSLLEQELLRLSRKMVDAVLDDGESDEE